MRDSQRDAADNRLARLLIRQGEKQISLTQTTVPGGTGSDDRTRETFINPMTALGDLITGDATGSPHRLAVGADGDVLTADSGAPNGVSWQVGGGGGYTNEQAQDAVGGILTDTSSIDFTYDDVANTITADVVLEWFQDTVAAMFTGGTDSGITVTYQDASGVIDLTVSGGGYTDEQVRDVIGAALVAGNNIDITVNDGADTITIDVESLTSADITDFSEAVDDRVSSLVVAGNNIDVTYNDGANTLTIDVESLTSADVTDFTEAAQDAVGGILTDTSSIDFTYDDVANTITAAVIDEAIQDIVGAMVVDSSSIDVTYNDGSNQLTAAIIDSYVNALIDARIGDLEGGEGSDPGNWLQTHRFMVIQATPGSTTISNYGGISGTASGTISQVDDADGNWIGYSTTTLNAIGGRGESLTFWADWGMTFMFRGKTFANATTSARHWFGMSSASSATLGASDAPTHACAMFRGSSAAGDTNWKCVTSDRSGSQTITDSGVPIAANTAYSFKIIFGTVRAKFYINGTLVATHDTGSGHLLPGGGATSANRLGWFVQCTNLVGGAGSDRGVKLGRVAIGTLN